MSSLEYRKLDDAEVSSELENLPGWAVEDGEISKAFLLKTYKDGLVFAVAVGHLADRLDHHPNLLIGYRKVTVSMNTHAVEGLSPYDFELARRIESIA